MGVNMGFYQNYHNLALMCNCFNSIYILLLLRYNIISWFILGILWTAFFCNKCVNSWATQSDRKLITLSVIYCFMKPEAAMTAKYKVALTVGIVQLILESDMTSQSASNIDLCLMCTSNCEICIQVTLITCHIQNLIALIKRHHLQQPFCSASLFNVGLN